MNRRVLTMLLTMDVGLRSAIAWAQSSAAQSEPAPAPRTGTSAEITSVNDRAASATPGSAGLSQEGAVSIAFLRNRSVIAARLNIDAAEFDRVLARVYPNPVLGYQVGNVVLGHGNPYNIGNGAPRSPGPFSQLVHTVSVSELIDVWNKRGKRIASAGQGIRYQRAGLEDVLREIGHSVRSAFADLLREQSELAFAREMRERYAETIRLSRSRFRAGEISESELRKIELEGLRYQNAVIDGELEYELARQNLAGLLALRSAAELPVTMVPEEVPALHRSLSELTDDAIEHRPDVRALVQQKRWMEASLDAARREAYPDLTLGLSYTHSGFVVSGDNPNTLGLSASVPIPLIDRNQAGIGHAQVEVRRAENELARLELQVRHEVAEAVSRYRRAQSLLTVFQDDGMLERAETSLRVAEKSYRAGAISLLELLEAQRTYLETRAQYLRAQYDHRQSAVDLAYAVGRKLP
jgi:outer membrane protein, heavy metal efflux system